MKQRKHKFNKKIYLEMQLKFRLISLFINFMKLYALIKLPLVY